MCFQLLEGERFGFPNRIQKQMRLDGRQGVTTGEEGRVSGLEPKVSYRK